MINSRKDSRGLLVNSSYLTDIQREEFREAWMKQVQTTGFAIINSFDNSEFVKLNNRLRIPRKIKKRLIGTGTDYKLICHINRSYIPSRKYLIQIIKK